MDSTSPILPYLGVVLAISCWGSFTVPLKHPAVIAANLHPLWFQCYVGVGVALSSIIFVPIATDSISDFTPWGTVSALMWVLCNSSAMAAVNLLGIATAQSTWGALIAIIAFVTGLLWGDKPDSLPLAVLGVVLLIAGIVVLAYVASQGNDESKALDKSTDLDTLLADEPSIHTQKNSNKTLGFCCVMLTGCVAGTIFIPLRLAPERYHDGLETVKFSFAQGVSTLPATVVWMPILFFGVFLFENAKEPRNNRLTFREWLPPSHFRSCFFPGFLSGCLWNFGNLGATLASLEPLQAVGYTLTQSALLVGCAWGLFVFKEVTGARNVKLFWTGAFITTAGLVVTGWFGRACED